jgi:CDP-diglyceride synthetase
MADERSPAERWVNFAAGIVAPVTLLTGLLFYFGYVSARSQYEYFGIDVDTIGLSTQDYVMRSPAPLPAPLLVIALFAVAGLLLHRAIHPTVAGVRRATWVAVVVLVLGVAALLASRLIGSLPYYGIVAPAVIGLAAAALAYLSYLRRKLDPEVGTQRVLIGLLAVVTVACAFWATATTAQYTGRGLAKSDARHLDRFPVVILDTKEKLALRLPGVEETALRAGAGQTFHYRYRGLRLLIVGQNRMFLVPRHWTASNTTVVVPLDDSIRVQFQFQNDPP